MMEIVRFALSVTIYDIFAIKGASSCNLQNVPRSNVNLSTRNPIYHVVSLVRNPIYHVVSLVRNPIYHVVSLVRNPIYHVVSIVIFAISVTINKNVQDCWPFILVQDEMEICQSKAQT